jgi:hypothetical protein
MSRLKLIALWFLVTLFMPLFSVVMLIQAVVGSHSRAKNMALAQDECGNSMFGGPSTQTMSSRVGDGLIEGKRWAKIIAPVIDFLFGAGHCLSNVDLAAGLLTEAQVSEVDAADKEQGLPAQY